MRKWLILVTACILFFCYSSIALANPVSISIQAPNWLEVEKGGYANLNFYVTVTWNPSEIILNYPPTVNIKDRKTSATKFANLNPIDRFYIRGEASSTRTVQYMYSVRVREGEPNNPLTIHAEYNSLPGSNNVLERKDVGIWVKK